MSDPIVVPPVVLLHLLDRDPCIARSDRLFDSASEFHQIQESEGERIDRRWVGIEMVDLVEAALIAQGLSRLTFELRHGIALLTLARNLTALRDELLTINAGLRDAIETRDQLLSGAFKRDQASTIGRG